jgi:predicted LPLAT superfamily acyltransferase
MAPDSRRASKPCLRFGGLFFLGATMQNEKIDLILESIQSELDLSRAERTAANLRAERVYSQRLKNELVAVYRLLDDLRTLGK